MNGRSYNQFCLLTSALDIVGERWTLLIIRELLVGPRRFKDLYEGLPGISTNLLSERLRFLEQNSVLYRHVQPPPSGSTVYELTPMGRTLENVVIELARWGVQHLPSSLEGLAVPSLGAVALAMKTFFRPDRVEKPNETYEIHFGQEILQVQVSERDLIVFQGQRIKADVVFYTYMQFFVALYAGQIEPNEAISGGFIRVEGDTLALDRFLKMCGAYS